MNNKETILVTGSSGFIGYPVAKRLAETYSVVGFDRRAPSHPPPSAECLYVDLTSDESLRRGLQAVRELHGERIAAVIHLAAYYDFSGEPSPQYDEVTVRGTERLLRMLQGFQVEQFVFSSTMLVHAPSRPGQPINEDGPLEPMWAYPQSKVRTEQVIHARRGPIPVVILRIAGVYDDLCNSVPLAHQIQRIYERQVTAYVFPGDLAHGQAFVHNDDVVDLSARLVERRHHLPPELTLLVGEAETPGYDALQRALGLQIHDEEWTTRPIPKPLARAGAWLQDTLPFGEKPFIRPWMIDRADDHYALDITRARTLLGWEPKRALRETIPTMVAALKADPVAWYRENKLTAPLWLQEIATTPNEGHHTETGHHPPMAAGPPAHGQKMDRQPMHHAMGMPEPPAREDGMSAQLKQLQQMRAQQAEFKAQREREEREQKLQDPLAQELMKRDPKGHVEMMRELQQQHAVVREQALALLRRQADVYQELVRMQPEHLPEPGRMMVEHHGMARWAQVPLLALGAWLVASPATLGYRSAALTWSDVLSGILVLVLAALSLSPRRAWAPWANTFVGLWLLFAPLVFWAPDAAAYANDTLVGALVVAFSILIPHMMPMPGPDIPFGWTYNPSTWSQRAPIIALGLVSFLMARYMAAFQLGHISTVWEPFFGNGTVQILTSDVSRAWPVSDAGLGALTYMVEVLSGFMADPRRWRTMPWMVGLFGVAVVPLGIVSVVLVILQPLAVGTWCTLCLASALFMLLMVALALDEVLAMLQFLGQSWRAGQSLWRTFWLGGNPVRLDEAKPARPASARPEAMVWGVSLPWNLVIVALLGVWLMAAPGVFGTQGRAADSDHLIGALVVTIAIIAWAEVARPVRFINGLLGAALMAAPWLLEGATTPAAWNDVIIGAAVVLLSLPRGPIRNSYGSWDRYIV